MTIGKRRLATAATALLWLASPPVAAGRDQAEVGIQVGLFMPDKDVSGKPQTYSEVELLSGVRATYHFADRWGWFIDATWSDINANTPAGDVDTLAGRTGFEVLFAPHWERKQWFLSAAGGLMNFDLESGASFDRSFASLSAGQRLALDHRARLRWELRGDWTLGDEGFDRKDVFRASFLLGLAWGLGGGGEDSDGDGVGDRRDACPDTPRGAEVDERGCPMDTDLDGVLDGIDRCPGTPRNTAVDPWGCPIDRGRVVDGDGDGVPDGADRCAATPRGATVDALGCPRDRDLDGVYDGIDRCPGTPRGAVVDSRGCPRDGDGDGVFDGLDDCPRTPRGVAVGRDGCPRTAPPFEPGSRTLILEGVRFATDSAVLDAGSRATLDRVAASLLDRPQIRVEVGGHTDSTASDAYNLKLSARRARAVRDYLVGKKVAADRLEVRGYGENRPIADNRTREGRAENRRVELKKLDP